MDPSQPIDESGPVGPFTEAPDEPPPPDGAPDVIDVTAGGPETVDAEAAGPAPAAETEDNPDAVDPTDTVDLDAIAADLADVERAMERLETATYWTDEVTGAPLDDAHLAAHPTARRAAGDPAPPPAP